MVFGGCDHWLVSPRNSALAIGRSFVGPVHALQVVLDQRIQLALVFRQVLDGEHLGQQRVMLGQEPEGIERRVKLDLGDDLVLDVARPPSPADPSLCELLN